MGDILTDLRDRYSVSIIGPDRSIVAQTKQWSSLDLVPRFNDTGTWSVELPANDGALQKLVKGGGVVFHREGEYLIGGKYRGFHKERSSRNSAGIVTLSGASHELVLGKMCFPDPTKTVDTQDGQVYDTRTGPAETVIYGYVNANAGPGARTDRRVSGLTMGTDLGRGSTVTGNADFDVLPDLISNLALTDGLGWRVVPDGSGLKFEVFVPRDLSGAVRFAWDLGNVTDESIDVTAPAATREIVAGQGVGVWRLFRQSLDSAAETDWGVSLEHFVDRRDTNDDTLLDQAGTEALTGDAAGVTVTMTTRDTKGVRFGRDWGVGDRVTYNFDGVEYVDTVREARITVSARGEVVQPTIGPAGASQLPWPYRGIGELIRAIQTQQRRR